MSLEGKASKVIPLALLAGFLVLGCTQPTSIYTTAIPDIEPAADEIPPTVAAQLDDAPEVAAMIPGERTPYTDDHGIATHRGLIFPQPMAADLNQAAIMAPYWEAAARSMQHQAEADRATGDAANRWNFQQRRIDRTEAAVLRGAVAVVAVAAAALFVGGVGLGLELAP